MIQKIILIRGPLGVGKSTIAKILAERIDALYISIDHVLEELGLDQVGENGIPLENFLAANEHVVQNVMRDTNYVIDGSFYHKGQVDDFVARFGNDLHIITLKAPVEVCIERDSNRERSYGEDAARAVHAMVSSFDVGIIIQTEGKSVEDVVEEIRRSIAV